MTASARPGPPAVGLVGASGMVGSAAAAALRKLGVESIRLGARRIDGVRRVLADVLDGRGEIMAVNATDPVSLTRFCAGCQVVLNCAGPTYLLRDTVAVAAVAVGAHYIDVAGDDPAWEGMAARGLAGTDRAVVFSAGTLPGLSSILPRWLAATGFGRPTTLTAHVGGREPCSPVVATDMILSLSIGGADGAAFGEPLAAWRGGARRPRVLRAASNAVAPFFPGPVGMTPFLSTETVRLARALGLDDVDWFNVYPGPAVHAEMQRMPGYAREPGTDLAEVGARLHRAAALDLVGRTPFYLMVFSMRGTPPDDAGTEIRRTLVLRTSSSYQLTGLVGALAARASLDGALPAGLHFACDVLDPHAVVREIREAGGSSLVEMHGYVRGADIGDDVVEEGAL
ncbi:saccharopine dehydrogenase NADP-binding domain-containing protein [Protofrankia symbiont of Coriaria ruscifolia]|uniref:saccharopine dehydrogenase NADP-binding domain-containing protein n=1 Tax=Protofrankia symbiont of Coriaria ruscifolia TaxID=1306542 RepID=UPI0010415FC8|nr:saccharopine dehydrogenase NADP-binding domain-containing protein [Protofrankia symbiont of Coriaria ruscifolia]